MSVVLKKFEASEKLESELRFIFGILIEVYDKKKGCLRKTKPHKLSILKNIETVAYVMILMVFPLSTTTLFWILSRHPNALSFPIAAIWLIGSSIGFLLVPLILLEFKKEKQSQPIQENLFKASEDAVRDQRLIHKLCEAADEKTLKLVESEFSFLIEEIRVREKVSSNLLPLLALVFVAVLIYLLGIPIQFFEENPLITGISGLVASVTLLLKFIRDYNSQYRILEHKKCLSLLEQAQAIKKNGSEVMLSGGFRFENMPGPSKQKPQKESLMSKLKSVQINAPEDFSANLDQYLSGEKRVDPDLH